jgi:hypothetical protein
MEEAKRSLWARSLQYRAACYSAATSVVVTGAVALLVWNHSEATFETSPYELAWICCGMFWLCFGCVGVFLNGREQWAATKSQNQPPDGSNDRRGA